MDDHPESTVTDDNEIDEANQAFLKQNKMLEQQTYLGSLKADSEIKQLKSSILQKIGTISDDCQSYRQNMQQFAYLWVVPILLYTTYIRKTARITFVESLTPTTALRQTDSSLTDSRLR